MSDNDIHGRLLALLDSRDAKYRVIKHEPEGRSEEISRIRGNDPAQAMKASCSPCVAVVKVNALSWSSSQVTNA